MQEREFAPLEGTSVATIACLDWGVRARFVDHVIAGVSMNNGRRQTYIQEIKERQTHKSIFLSTDMP